FPKAHAAAYVIMAFRIAWYKINYPAAYYAAYFGIRAKEFDLKVISAGLDAIRDEMARLQNKAKTEKLTGKEDLSMVSLELALEMYCRGYSCSGIDLKRSESRFFIPDDKTIIPPFTAVSGLGMSVAENIVAEREKKMFISQDDMQERTKINNTCLEQLGELGCLEGLPKSDQISFFNF
ncbi:MAG: PolC-type DNA polymerase III, partial [Eubacteriaceae bacterium]